MRDSTRDAFAATGTPSLPVADAVDPSVHALAAVMLSCDLDHHPALETHLQRVHELSVHLQRAVEEWCAAHPVPEPDPDDDDDEDDFDDDDDDDNDDETEAS